MKVYGLGYDVSSLFKHNERVDYLIVNGRLYFPIAHCKEYKYNQAKIRHGHWIINVDSIYGDTYVCSECGTKFYEDTECCPGCGAKMDGGCEIRRIL